MHAKGECQHWKAKEASCALRQRTADRGSSTQSQLLWQPSTCAERPGTRPRFLTQIDRAGSILSVCWCLSPASPEAHWALASQRGLTLMGPGECREALGEEQQKCLYLCPSNPWYRALQMPWLSPALVLRALSYMVQTPDFLTKHPYRGQASPTHSVQFTSSCKLLWPYCSSFLVKFELEI